MLRNLNGGLKPKLGLAILALDMHMHSRLFPREEVEPEATLTKHGWTHRQNDTRKGVGVGELIASHSWGAVKPDLYGLKFYTMQVLRKPWLAPGLIKLPHVKFVCRVAHTEAIGSPLTDSLAKWTEMMKSASGGRIDAQHFPASQLGSYTQLIEQSRLGTIQTTTGGPDTEESVAPEVAVTGRAPGRVVQVDLAGHADGDA